MASLPTLGPLFARLFEAARAAGLFAGILLAVYLPGRMVVVPLLKGAGPHVPVSETVWHPVVKVTNGAFALFALYLAVPLSGLATTPTAVAALSAAATLAIGFASQDVLSNLVIGDWIRWKDREGVIEDISFRVTRVHTFDNELITVPNSELTANAVVNPASKDTVRIVQELPISYEDSVADAEETVVDVARGHEGILDRPRSTVRVGELGDSAIVLVARFWIDQPARADILRVRSEFVTRVTERFDEEGIEMPYPHRELTGGIETRPPADDTGPEER